MASNAVITVRTVNHYKVIDINRSAREFDDISLLKEKVYELIDNQEKFIAVNISNMDYIHSYFIKIITSSYNKIKKDGGNFCVIGPNKFILNLLQMLNITSYLSIFENEESFKKACAL